ncbi:MAG TPA: protein kinase [Flavitalea sp.]|nr:protein kinase [Flavitalea sp.]
MSTERFDSPGKIIGSHAEEAKTTRIDSAIISADAPVSSPAAKSYQLNNKLYNVVRQIASSGEAELFLVEEGGKQQVLKYYFSNYKPKDEVIRKLQSIRRNDFIVPLDYGYHHDRFWEINEYMEGGTLGDILPVKDIALFKDLVHKITETIHACHSNNIIHRDIKPVNIFFRHPDRQEIVLGDFGIASPVQDGENYRVTTVARTSTYAAPELFTNIDNYTTLDNKVDYYALGISLLEMWIGDDPFKGIMQFNIMRIKTEGRVSIPPDIHPDIEMLIKGLITTEPPKRWGYEEVKKWLRGEPVKVHYQTQNIKFAPYDFDAVQGIQVNNPRELAHHMERNPQKAAKQLYSHSISEWIKTASQDMYSEVFDIVERAYPNTSEDNISAGITKTIYLLDKDRAFKSYDGSEWQTPQDLGAHIEQHAGFYKNELSNPAAKLYLFLEARGFQERADKYRRYYKNHPADKAFNLVILDLQDNKLKIDGHSLDNINQLTATPGPLAQKIVNEVADGNSKVSIWLDINFNHLADDINRWRHLNNYTVKTLSYALHTGGLRIADGEAMNPQEFYQLIDTSPELITTDPDAANNRQNADYWLRHYQKSSLLQIIVQNDFLGRDDLSPSQFEAIYEYLLTGKTDKNPFEITIMICRQIQKLTAGNNEAVQVVVNMAKPAYHRFMDEHRQTKVYATESLYDIVGFIRKINEVYPALASETLLSLDAKLSAFIHEDFNNLKNNSEYFDILRGHVKTFLQNSVAPINNDLPYYQHWQKEQQLIERQSSALEFQIAAEQKKEEAEILQKFKQFVTTSIENQINYLEKGKTFYIIFVKTITWLIIIVCMLIAYAEPQAMSSMIGTAVILFLVMTFITRRVRRRRPHNGLGIIFDPLHKLMGKLLYRPVLKKMRADKNSALNNQMAKAQMTELEKSNEKFKGKKFNLLFEERARVILLPQAQLENELAKI